MEAVENKTWWTKKNYKKYLNILINEGVDGIERLDRCPIVPETEVAFDFFGAHVDYFEGVGFVFIYDMPVEIENVSYHVVYERTFYFNKIEDRTYLTTAGLGHEIDEQYGFVKFPRRSCGFYDVEDWAKNILKDYEKEENNGGC